MKGKTATMWKNVYGNETDIYILYKEHKKW